MINPTRGNILIEPIMSDEKTEGGLFVSDISRGYIFYGKVIGIGAGIDRIKIGQKVAYKARGCHEVDIGGNKFFIATMDEIFGIDCGNERIAMIGDHFLIKQVKSKTTPGGKIVLPGKTDDDEEFGINTSQIGVVCALESNRSGKIKLGDWICFESGIASGFPVTIGGEEYRVINEKSIMFTIEVER